jgi:hypothetical protein
MTQFHPILDSIFISGSPESPEDHIIVAIYVDDILLLAKHSSLIDTLAMQLGTAFRTRNMGPVKRFLAMDVIKFLLKLNLKINIHPFIRNGLPQAAE